MALRQAPLGLEPTALQLDQTMSLSWDSYRCELVTPLYGGGVKGGETDERMPVRVSAIRGQLRFWWRLLAMHKYKLSAQNARQEEFALWGGLAERPQASRVWLRVEDVSEPEVEAWAEFTKNNRGEWKALPDPKGWARDAAYALFPGQGKKPGSADAKDPAALVKPGLTWTLNLAFRWLAGDPDGTERKTAEARVLEALRWWASFGGVGARTRRGLGAVWIRDLAPVDEKEAELAGCRLVLAGSGDPDAGKSWQTAIKKLRDFRQAPGFGRNPGSDDPRRPGRSRWPEPDAIRRLTGMHASRHAPEHRAGDLFPRAAFGMPIIFQFKDEKAGDPASFTLNPAGAERMASPLILRPYQLASRWYPGALLLPTGHLDEVALTMPARSVMQPGSWWNPDMAEMIPPLAPHGKDALSAFLHYFAGK